MHKALQTKICVFFFIILSLWVQLRINSVKEPHIFLIKAAFWKVYKKKQRFICKDARFSHAVLCHTVYVWCVTAVCQVKKCTWKWVEVTVCRGSRLRDKAGPLFSDGESGSDCSQSSLNWPATWVWRFHVYCMRHPVMLTINRPRYTDGCTAVPPAGNERAKVMSKFWQSRYTVTDPQTDNVSSSFIRTYKTTHVYV